jgi:hypothetical protein
VPQVALACGAHPDSFIASRQAVIALLSTLIVLPISALRDLHKLALASFVSVASVVLIVAIVLFAGKFHSLSTAYNDMIWTLCSVEYALCSLVITVISSFLLAFKRSTACAFACTDTAWKCEIAAHDHAVYSLQRSDNAHSTLLLAACTHTKTTTTTAKTAPAESNRYYADSIDRSSTYVFARSSAFSGFGAISFAFVCQSSTFILYRSLRGDTRSVGSWKR